MLAKDLCIKAAATGEAVNAIKQLYQPLFKPATMATNKVVPMDVMTSALGNAFRSERLIYRALEDNDADLDFIFTHLESDPVNAALSNPSIHRPVSKKVIDERFKLMIKTAMLATMICLPDGPSGESKPIGYVSIKENLPFQRRGLLGIQISPAYQVSSHISDSVHNHLVCVLTGECAEQNKGYGTEVINWAIDWAFTWGGLHSLALGASLYNERAVSVYRKAGFKQEGVSREAVYRNRKWHDVVQMAILENEWEELRRVAKSQE